MHLKAIFILITFLTSGFYELGSTKDLRDEFLVKHLHPDELKRVKTSTNSTKLVGILAEYPLSYYPVKDSTGKVIRKEGVSPLIFWWTADRFNFDAELMERTISIPFDRNITLPVSYYEMLKGRINLNLGFFVMTPKRNRLVDFTHPFFMEPLTLIIPNPVVNGDIWSAWKTFEPQIWTLLFVSIVALALTFLAFNWFYSSIRFTQDRVHKDSFMYLIQVLLNQGSVCNSTSFAIRFLAGIWCLMACVLVNTYSSTMTAHLLVSYPVPIIRSIFDLPNQSAVNLAVKKGSGTDFLLSTAEKGLYKQLGEMLQSQQNNSRCATDQECLELVRTGSYAYANPEFAAFDAMINAYRSTQKCEFTVIREYSLAISMAFFTLKNSPVREQVNRGILEMSGYGMIEGWIARHRPMLSQCPKTASSKLKSNKDDRKATESNVQLSLRNLTGAFVFLAFGMALAFCVFIGELLVARCSKRFVLKQKMSNKHAH